MINSITFVSILIICCTMISCEKVPSLNGHYHMYINQDSSNFSTWTIIDNQIQDERLECLEEQNCFSQQVSFSHGRIKIDPWPCTSFDYEYDFLDNGTVLIFIESGDTLKFVPRSGCESAIGHLNHLTEGAKIKLPYAYYSNLIKVPASIKNNMVVYWENDSVRFRFNGQLIGDIDQFNFPDGKGEEVVLYIDSSIPISKFITLIKGLNNSNYFLEFASMEPDLPKIEVVTITSRDVIDFRSENDGTIIIEYCEHCNSYENYGIDSIIQVELLETGMYLFLNDTIEEYRLRRNLEEYLSQNRSTRISTEIQVTISDKISFGTYLEYFDMIGYLNECLSNVRYYNGAYDPDQKEIKQIQEMNMGHLIQEEFPIRLKEIIKTYP